MTFIILHPISASAITCCGMMISDASRVVFNSIRWTNALLLSFIGTGYLPPCNDQAGLKALIIEFFEVLRISGQLAGPCSS